MAQMDPSGHVRQSCLEYGDKPLFGFRDRNGKFVWPITYNRFWRSAKSIALKLLSKIQPEKNELLPMENAVPAVAIASSVNRWEWTAVDVGCGIAGLLSVGIHTSWPINELKKVLVDTGVVIVVTDMKSKHIFEETGLNHLIYIDMDEMVLENCDVDEKSIEHQRTLLNLNTSPYHTVIYSSGTTGVPKGLGILKKKWISGILIAAKYFEQQGDPKTGKIPNFSLVTLNRELDRELIWQGIVLGARVGFVRNESEDAFYEDIAEVSPVYIAALSEVWIRLYARYQQLVADNLHKLKMKTGTEAEAVSETGGGTEAEAVSETGGGTEAEGEAEAHRSALAQASALINGGNTRVFVSAGAYAGKDVLRFMHECFPTALIFDAYGATEVVTSIPGVSINGKISPAVELKLVDVPECGFTANDMPNPTGEIWLRAPGMSTEYWGSTWLTDIRKLSNAAFVKEEDTNKWWYRTGDIGEIDRTDGTLRVLDRRTQLAELYLDGRSVWLPLAPREALYRTALGLRVCLLSSRMCSGLVALVEMKSSSRAGTGKGTGTDTGTSTENDTTLEKRLLQKMRRAAQEQQKEGGFDNGGGFGAGSTGSVSVPFEMNIPFAVVCSPYVWSEENGALTRTGKMRRGMLLRMHEAECRAAFISRDREEEEEEKKKRG